MAQALEDEREGSRVWYCNGLGNRAALSVGGSNPPPLAHLRVSTATGGYMYVLKLESAIENHHWPTNSQGFAPMPFSQECAGDGFEPFTYERLFLRSFPY